MSELKRDSYLPRDAKGGRMCSVSVSEQQKQGCALFGQDSMAVLRKEEERQHLIETRSDVVSGQTEKELKERV